MKLPEEAHRRLQLARNHLELLSRLAEPRTRKEETGDTPPIPLGVWSTCLAQLAELITKIQGSEHLFRTHRVPTQP
jgi:hypothetical protein